MSLNKMYRHLAAALLAGILLFWELGSPGLNNQEARVGAVVQHMEDTGELLLPHIGPDLYFNKPLLGHWAVLVSSQCLGLSETSARLPSALAGLAVIWLTWLLARQWYGKETALLASLALAGTFTFVQWSRAARVEMLNLLAVLAIFYLFFTYRKTGDAKWWYSMALVMGVGAHLKGLLTFAVPGFAILALSLVFKDWKWLNARHLAVGIALSAGLFSLPFVLVWSISGTAEPVKVLYRENILRLFAPFDHLEPFYFYGYEFFRFTLPWSALAPWLIAYLIVNRQKLNLETRHLLVVIAAIVGFFQLSSSRRAYYLLPVLPFTSILVAHFLTRLPDLGPVWRKSIGWLWTLSGAALQVPLLLLLFARRSWVETWIGRYAGDSATRAGVVQALYSPRVIASAVACCLIGGLVVWIARKSTPLRISLVATACCAVLAVFFGLVNPVLDPSDGLRDFAAEIKRTMHGRPNVLAFAPSLAHASGLIYYLRLHDCRVFHDLDEAKAKLAGGALLLIHDRELPSSSWRLLGTEGGWTTRRRRSTRWRLYERRATFKDEG